MINTLDITNCLENVSFIILFHFCCSEKLSLSAGHIISFKNNRWLLRTSASDIRLCELKSHLQQTKWLRCLQRLPTYSNYYFLNDCQRRPIDPSKATCLSVMLMRSRLQTQWWQFFATVLLEGRATLHPVVHPFEIHSSFPK